MSVAAYAAAVTMSMGMLGCQATPEEIAAGSAEALSTPMTYDALTNTFSRVVDRTIQSTNPKQFPFRVSPSTNVVINLTRAGASDSTFELFVSADEVTWTSLCTGTSGASPVSATCAVPAGKGFARIDMTTVAAGAGFTLDYEFTGPSGGVHQSELATTTMTASGLLQNYTTKASIGGDGVTYAGAFAGQALRLTITRSHPNVAVDPNGPKLKDQAHPQYDGIDFVCGAWVNIAGTSPQQARMTCTLQGAATEDSYIHVPFQTSNATTSGRTATVLVERDFRWVHE